MLDIRRIRTEPDVVKAALARRGIDVSDIDRLASGAVVSRTRRNEYVSAGLWHYQSIRAGESNATLPSLVGDLVWHRRFSPQLLGGQGGYGFTVIGVLVLQVLSSFLIGIGLDFEWQQFIFGLLILPMVALYARSPHIRTQI